MKKLIMLVLALVCVVGLIGCGRDAEDLKEEFPQYFDLGTFKGLEVYVWETEPDEYSCGVLPGTNRNKFAEEFAELANNGVTIEEMKIILSSYDITRDEIAIIPIKNPSSNYEIIYTDRTQFEEFFWEY